MKSVFFIKNFAVFCDSVIITLMVKTKIILINDKDAISQAQAILAQDGVIVFPTDTVYGLGVNFRSKKAINKLFAIKGRGFN